MTRWEDVSCTKTCWVMSTTRGFCSCSCPVRPGVLALRKVVFRGHLLEECRPYLKRLLRLWFRRETLSLHEVHDVVVEFPSRYAKHFPKREVCQELSSLEPSVGSLFSRFPSLNGSSESCPSPSLGTWSEWHHVFSARFGCHTFPKGPLPWFSLLTIRRSGPHSPCMRLPQSRCFLQRGHSSR